MNFRRAYNFVRVSFEFISRVLRTEKNKCLVSSAPMSCCSGHSFVQAMQKNDTAKSCVQGNELK